MPGPVVLRRRVFYGDVAGGVKTPPYGEPVNDRL